MFADLCMEAMNSVVRGTSVSVIATGQSMMTATACSMKACRFVLSVLKGSPPNCGKLMQYTWRRATSSNPCQICGAKSWCTPTAEGPVKCMGNPDSAGGWKAGKVHHRRRAHVVPGRLGKGADDFDADQVAARKKLERSKLKRRVTTAVNCWKAASANDLGRIEEYLRARGIPDRRAPWTRCAGGAPLA